jgi:glycosyltransferase involved in cell wall biosynthesis
MHTPFFSVVIPVYNRAALIGRALRSCLEQDFTDFEIIVVDDGSADDSVAAIRRFDDPRLKVIEHERNRGVGPARNSGMAGAIGEWIVCLDSDDELLPGALRTMHDCAVSIGHDVDGLRFMVLMANGFLSPDPPLIAEVWDYGAYLRWVEASFDGSQETMTVVRRRTFDSVRYSGGRADEALYHLDFAQRFRVAAHPDVVRLYHHDAGNQRSKPSVAQMTGEARDQALQTESLLEEHGEALRRWAPRVHQRFMAELATMYFLAGQRIQGIRAALRSLRGHSAARRQWALLLLGLAGPRPLAFMKMLRGKARAAEPVSPRDAGQRAPAAPTASNADQ